MSWIAEIRDALKKSSVPLSTADLIEALGFHGATASEKKPVYQAISNGVLKGHFIRHHSSEGLSYSINADHAPGKRGRKTKKDAAPKPKPKPKPQPQPKPQPASAAPASVDSSLSASRTPLGRFVGDSSENMASQAQIEAFNERRPAPPAAPAPKPTDFDLRRRLDAIGTDIADAIADACDAQHPHALIKALVVSREALSRAQQAISA